MPSLNIIATITVKCSPSTDRGKTGRVCACSPTEGARACRACGIVRRRFRASRERTKGGIAEQESPINVSNVAVVCPTCRTCPRGYKVGDSKVRVCKKCGKPADKK